MADSSLNTTGTRGELIRETSATYINHTSGSEPDHLSSTNDNPGSEQGIGMRNAAPEHPQQYWQRNESVAGLQVVPEQPGLQVVEDKEVAHESVDELSKRHRFRRWLGQRVCGIPFWTLMLLAIILIIGAIVSGIIGGLKSKTKDNNSQPTCHPMRNSTICGTRLNKLPSASSQTAGTPHPLPVNGTWYYLTTQSTFPGPIADLILSISPNSAQTPQNPAHKPTSPPSSGNSQTTKTSPP